ncbi:MAG: hypothetical protein H6550_16320 [Chitinophagales bacterium]|nr:hypothetical protein [Chitinophagales bacterium]
MKILIIGHAGHGKDTAAEVLMNNGFTATSSSIYALHKFVYPLLKVRYGYKDTAECFKDRVNHRREWFDLIAAYSKDDPSRLTREILESNDIYIGMRNMEEFTASEKLFDLIVAIDASERLPLEDPSSFNIPLNVADIIIYNNGDADDLKWNMNKLVGILSSVEDQIEVDVALGGSGNTYEFIQNMLRVHYPASYENKMKYLADKANKLPGAATERGEKVVIDRTPIEEYLHDTSVKLEKAFNALPGVTGDELSKGSDGTVYRDVSGDQVVNPFVGNIAAVAPPMHRAGQPKQPQTTPREYAEVLCEVMQAITPDAGLSARIMASALTLVRNYPELTITDAIHRAVKEWKK